MKTRRVQCGGGDRRAGLALLAVMALVTIAAAVGAGVVVRSAAGVSTQRVELDALRSRAAAWSAVQAVVTEFAGQREELVVAGEIDLPDEFELFTEDDGRVAVARLMPLPDGRTIQPEAGKLDVNHATRDELAGLGLIGEELAGRIIAARARSPIESVESLLAIEGVTLEMMYGSGGFGEGNAVVTRSEASGSRGSEAGQDTPGRRSDSLRLELTGEPRSLLDALTAFSADPNVQMGIGASDEQGERRVRIAGPWSDRLERAIERRFGEDIARFAEQAYQNPDNIPGSRQDLVSGVPDLDLLDRLLDFAAFTNDEFVVGLVDVNTASPAVLGALEGLTRSQAEEIVSVRDSLGSDQRMSPLWLVREDVLTREAFAPIADRLTTRCLQYRVRIEVGYLPGEFAASGPSVEDESRALASALDAASSVADANRMMASSQSDADALENRVVLDVVIDLASQRPRVAYLREVTMLPTALAAAASSVNAEALEQAADPLAQLDSGGSLSEADLDGVLRGLGGEQATLTGEPAAPRGRARPTQDRVERPSRPSQNRVQRPARPVQRAAEDVGGSASPTDRTEQDGASSDSVDRRQGRWRVPPRSNGKEAGA